MGDFGCSKKKEANSHLSQGQAPHIALNFVARAEREEPLPSLAMRSQSWRSSPRCCSPSTWSCSQSCSPSTLRSPARCTDPPPPRLVRGSTRTPAKPVVCPRGTSLSLSFSFVFSRFHRSAAITLIQRKSQVWPLASSEKGLISEKTRVSSRTLSIRLYLLSFVCLRALLASSTISLYSEVLNWPDHFFAMISRADSNSIAKKTISFFLQKTRQDTADTNVTRYKRGLLSLRSSGLFPFQPTENKSKKWS